MPGRPIPILPLALVVMQLGACASPGQGDRCEILSETVVRLGGDGEEGSFASYPYVSPLVGAGFYIGVSRDVAPELPAVFDASGRFLRPLGRSGDGPGEYRDPVLFLSYPGDSVLVVDATLMRGSILNRDGVFVRSFTLPMHPYTATALESGAMVIGSGSFGDQFPITAIEPDGAVRSRFDLGAPQPRGTPTARYLARNGPESIWAVPTAVDYHFEQWSLDGALLRVLKPERDWFISGLPYLAHSPTQPFRPFATGVWQDSAGVLWSAAIRADAQWAEGLGPPTGGEGPGRYYPIADYTLAWDGMVEAMDTLTGALIASRRFDVPIFYVAAPGLVVQSRATSDGWWKAELLRLRLTPACAGK